jgi:hypothetical protein
VFLTANICSYRTKYGISEMKYRPVISVRVILFLKVSGEDEGASVDGDNTSMRVLRFPL